MFEAHFLMIILFGIAITVALALMIYGKKRYGMRMISLQKPMIASKVLGVIWKMSVVSFS